MQCCTLSISGELVNLGVQVPNPLNFGRDGILPWDLGGDLKYIPNRWEQIFISSSMDIEMPSMQNTEEEFI